MKNPNLDELSEEELKEYLAKHSDEDLRADMDGGVASDDTDVVAVAEEIQMPAPKKARKVATKEEKERKKAEKLREKQIAKRRRQLRKNTSTLIRYKIDPEIGLTDEIAEQRMIDELTNRTKTKSNRSVFRIIMHNLFTFFNILIFVIAGILIWQNAPITDFVFLLMVSCNVIIGIIQEINAKNMIDKLSLMNAPTAFVKRSGVVHEIPIEDVVLDDCLLLENGRQICADSIVLEGAIEVNESLLTGESDAILKKPGDQLFSGSYVVSGKCSARVDKIGKDNYIEKLASQAKQYKAPKSDLYGSLNKIIKFMAFPVVICGALLFWRMYSSLHPAIYSTEMQEIVRKTAGAMIGMIPSGLFLMSTIALYIGVIKLGQRNVLVQDVYCVEMLARVNCICLDKTGTITDGTMVVKNVIDYNNVHGLATRNIVSAMLNALQDRNMTSQALKEKFGLGKRIRHTATIPFSSSRKFQAVTFDKYGTFALGAPEFVLKEDYKRVEKDVNKYAALGYRVLCLAHKEGTITGTEMPEGPIEILSMILIEDNIRPDAINTIKYFKDSGVEVRVISGDNPITVSKIAARAGVDGAERFVSLDGKSDSDVINEVRKGTTVFGRVSPEQKKLIIKTLKDLGKTVAMTGDGVNDILALKEADCSIAVASGSQAVRSCSHLVLLDSNFDSMPSVVAEGRRVINNVAKVAALFLTKTIFSLFLAIEALITGDYPISTSQLIIIEAFAIGIPSLILVNEPNNRPVKGRFLANVIRESLPGALVILIISAIVFLLANELNLNSISLRTIIVIAATHTCMMVLFKVCRPFNTIHKLLCGFCYSMFIIIILFVPRLLELRPIVSFAEYESNKQDIKYLSKYPSISMSSKDSYVVDGKVVNLTSSGKGWTVSAAEVDGLYYYKISDIGLAAGTGIVLDTRVYMPDVSYSNKGDIYVGGYSVYGNIEYSDELNLTVDNLGNLKANGKYVKITLPKSNEKYNFEVKYGNYNEAEAVVTYNILPTITVSSDEYIINGITNKDLKYHVPSSFSKRDGIKVTIDPDTLVVSVNGTELVGTTDSGDEIVYRASMPTITTDGKRKKMYLDSVATGQSIWTIFGDTSYVVPEATGTLYTIYDADNNAYTLSPQTSTKPKEFYKNGEFISDFTFADIGNLGFSNYLTKNEDSTFSNIRISNLTLMVGESSTKYILNRKIDETLNMFYTCSGADLSNAVYGPDISVAQEGNYIIDGYYTEYGYNASSNLDPHINEENYLVLGGVVTDYKVSSNDIKTAGGTITRLPVSHLVFLIMLCAVAGPLMRLLQNTIPWILKQGKALKKFLTKLQ